MVSHIIGRMEFCLSLTPDRMLLLAPELDAFFGSVTKIDIVKLFQENSIEIDKKYIDLSSPIKTLGEHKIDIIFTGDISGSFSLLVEKED